MTARREHLRAARRHLAAYGDLGLNASPRLVRAAYHLRSLGHYRAAAWAERQYREDLKLRAKYMPWGEADQHDLDGKLDRLRSAHGLKLTGRDD